MTKILYILIALLSFHLSTAQHSETKIEMTLANWEASEQVTFETFDNRETLVLNSGRVSVKNQTFSNGTIEVDVYANSVRSFAGITFRREGSTMEEAYMRMHKSRQVDAVQYTPIFNNESNWQLYREHQARVTFKNEGWNHFRIDVNNGTADVYVNDKKVLTVPNLKTSNSSGEIGLFALFENRFSNFRFTPKDPVANTEQTDVKPANFNIITKWNVTEGKTYTDKVFSFEDLLHEEYTTYRTEKSGLLPISKFVKKTSSGNFEGNEEDYIIASTVVHADQKETKLFSFDYSDRVIVYLNGNVVFKGSNAFRTKGVQYMGHMNINTNTLYLTLKKGVNHIHCVVIDKANGWGLMGKLE